MASAKCGAHKALPHSAYREKHPARWVGDAERARAHVANPHISFPKRNELFVWQSFKLLLVKMICWRGVACNAFGREAERYRAPSQKHARLALGVKPAERVLEPRGSCKQLPSRSVVRQRFIELRLPRFQRLSFF